MHIPAFRPAVANDAELTGGEFDDLGAIVLLEPVIEHVAEPDCSLGIGKLVDEQPATALVGIERVVLTGDDLRLAVAVEIGDRQRVRDRESDPPRVG